MNEDIFASIVNDMKNEFDSHDFIKEFIWRNPTIYGNLLIKYDNVTRAHAEISRFLLDHSRTLMIEKVGEKDSDGIFDHSTSCANWRRVQ